MCPDWREHEPGRAGLSVAGLGDEESMVVSAIAEPYFAETEESDEAFHVPCVVESAPDHMTDMSEKEIDSETEYNIINSSSGFFNAMLDAFPEGQDVAGETLEITAYQPGDNFSRSYEIDAQ